MADITGGDSLTDLYGFRRLLVPSLYKLLPLLTGIRLVLLPQTYGPFRGVLSRALARLVISRASLVLARDQPSIEELTRLLKPKRPNLEPVVVLDVAFLLRPKPPVLETWPSVAPSPEHTERIGLNVSGLLYNGGYTRRNMFALRCDYRRLVLGVAEDLLNASNAHLLLIPHVVTPPGHIESDTDACEQVLRGLPAEYHGRVSIARHLNDPAAAKYVIGTTSFFVGSRMHACIAAASQAIPTVPLAYSSKFAGVFATIDAADAVADLRLLDESQTRAHVLRLYKNRGEIRARLKSSVPEAQSRSKQTLVSALKALVFS